MEIVPYDESLRGQWTELFMSYFTDDLRVQEDDPRCTPDVIRNKLCPYIIKEVDQGAVCLDLLIADGEAAGFSAYQIDAPGSDWCKRPGWGFIREFHIRRDLRRRGYGRALADCTEARLRALGAAHIYLTSSEEAVPFWLACGYTAGGETDAENGQPVLEK